MLSAILATKLHIPTQRHEAIRRPRLVAQLNAGLNGRLTLVSAPAGFGKTTLIAQWVTRAGLPAAWLSLDEADNDPARFLAYLVAALHTVMPTSGERLSDLLQSSHGLPPELALTNLLNDLAAAPGQFILVLDDYHTLHTEAVDQMLVFLVEHAPPQMHVVIASREEPSLPLARFRARGQLSELRAADLSFTLEEATAFFNQAIDLNLSAEHIAALESRTEGWAAGLQLAALSMRGRPDVASFIQAFAGSHRFVLDYLVEEVLQRQSEDIRAFLLQTAVLERLNGPLCDALTGRENSRAMLDTLERGNLFVIPLDDQRQWYRYHHLFADALRASLAGSQSGRITALHRQASLWYEQNQFLGEAIHHALAAEDFPRAASLMERAWPSIDRSSQHALWLGWIKALPEGLIHVRPVLATGCAQALLTRGAMESAEFWLAEAEKCLNGPPATMVVADAAQLRGLPAAITMTRAYIAQARGDVPGTIQYARQILDLLPESDAVRRLQASALLGLACWTTGDLQGAAQAFSDCVMKMQAASASSSDIISATFVQAAIEAAQGHLHEALATLDQCLQFILKQGEKPSPSTAELYRGIADLHCEWGNLDEADRCLQKSAQQIEHSEMLDRQRRLCESQARLRMAQGDPDGALELLDEAQRQSMRTPLPDIYPIAAHRARVRIAQGKLAEALAWAQDRGLSADDNLSYLREFEHITLARLLIALYRRDRDENALRDADGLLKRLLQAATEGGRIGSEIEILVLQALAHEAQGNLPLALKPTTRALALAQPEGFVRVFLEEGAPMARILAYASAQGMMPGAAGKLLAALETRSSWKPGAGYGLIDPLTPREQEVLRLMAVGRSNPEIAASLVIAVTTVKTHVQHIFEKLQVEGRFQAITRARELHLI